MVAHENAALADAISRHPLRLPPRNELRASEAETSRNNKRKANSMMMMAAAQQQQQQQQRFSDDADDDSDTEDDVPIAAHFSKIMKMEKARSASQSQSRHATSNGTSSVNRIDNSKMYKTSETANHSLQQQQHQRQQQHQHQSVPVVTPPSSKERDGTKRSKPEAPKFLLLLFEILQTENPKVIRWSEDGLSLQILDPALVTDKILPKYFNHTNFHSFQRQLNYFGFRKWTKSKTDICTFSHPYFRQNQPELLQLIKRKKAPRRTPVADKVDGYCNQLDGKKQLLPLSPTGKRKLPASAAASDENDRHHRVNSAASSQSQTHHHHMYQQQQQHQGLNASNVLIQPAQLHGVAITPLSQHQHQIQQQQQQIHRDQAGLQYLPASALLNNVISPLAASECNKKAKKIDKKAYLPASSAAEYHASKDPTAASMCEMSAAMHSAGDRLSAVNVYSHSLPTLDIVRSRIIRRQNVSNQAQSASGGNGTNGEHFAYHGYASPLTVNSSLAAATAQMLENSRPELMNPMTPVGVGGGDNMNTSSPAGFTNSFSDPVDILLRIKKSRAMSTSDGQQNSNPNQLTEAMMISASDPNNKQAVEQQDMASLHNFLISHTLYTNRLESQLKMAMEENDALKHLVDDKHREVELLKSERKRLQQENAVLVDDKNKLFEINRELLGKLFPQ